MHHAAHILSAAGVCSSPSGFALSYVSSRRRNEQRHPCPTGGYIRERRVYVLETIRTTFVGPCDRGQEARLPPGGLEGGEIQEV